MRSTSPSSPSSPRRASTASTLEPYEKSLLNQMAQMIEDRNGFTPIVISGSADQVGIVTVHDGPTLSVGEIIAPAVGNDPSDKATYHSNFQDAERFLNAGGYRGRQLQVLVEGTYYINRLFATVELVPKTMVEVGTSVSSSPTRVIRAPICPARSTGTASWSARASEASGPSPLLPGKYAFNTYAGRVIVVPTTNFILKWNRTEFGAHKYDENLAEVDLITKDAFEPALPLSVVVHIDYRKAPLVVQRFGDIQKLVEQTLDPMVSAYFKNVAQTRTLIQLIQDRAAIQQQSGLEMHDKFAAYNLELQEVLIGTPQAGKGGEKIQEILTQLRSRQVAIEQVETYNRQQSAAVKERELREAEARARQQTTLTESEISISVQSNQGKADLARAQQQAAQIQALAQAEANRTRMMGEGEAARISSLASAEAEREARVGIARAMAIEEQVKAYGGPRFQLTQSVMSQFATAVQESGVDLVPKVVIGGMGSGDGSDDGVMGGSVIQALLAILLSEKMGVDVAAHTASSPHVVAMKADLMARMESSIPIPEA